MSRREVDRRADREREPEAPRKQPARASAEAPSARAARPQLNEYFIDGEGIHRQVLQAEICKYLGAEATCRPGEFQGRQGFKIKALRPFTPDMLDDLKDASAAFVEENRNHRRTYDQDIAYGDSQTRQRNEPQVEYNEMRNDPRYPPVPPNSAYPGPNGGFQGPPSMNYPPGYQGGSTYSTMPSMPAYTMPSDPRYDGPGYNYTHERPRDYPQGYPAYSPSQGYRDSQFGVDSRMPPDYYGTPGSAGRGGPMPEMPREYYEQMQGLQQSNGYGPPSHGPPSRVQQPSPYDNGPSARDAYRGVAADPYRGSRR